MQKRLARRPVSLEKYNLLCDILTETHQDSCNLRTGKYENCGFPPVELASVDFAGGTILLRADITEDATCQYSYSLDGERFEKIGAPVAVETGQWIGAKIGIFCINPGIHDGSGHADFARFEVEPLAREAASN